MKCPICHKRTKRIKHVYSVKIKYEHKFIQKIIKQEFCDRHGIVSAKVYSYLKIKGAVVPITEVKP